MPFRLYIQTPLKRKVELQIVISRGPNYYIILHVTFSVPKLIPCDFSCDRNCVLSIEAIDRTSAIIHMYDSKRFTTYIS